MASSSSTCTSCERDVFAASNGKFTPAKVINIHPEVTKLRSKLIADRRHFHQYPELSFQEVNTAKYIVERLTQIGVDEIHQHIGRTGVVGIIKGTKAGSGKPLCIALRADMDALPLQELETEMNTEYRSKVKDVMHACGHDGHMASLLCAASVFVEKRSLFSGTIKLVFQPAEEGLGGAREMIADGVLDEGKLGPHVDEVYGIHLWNYLPYGYIGVRPGTIMASSDKFEITIHGVGGHGAVPEVSSDAIVATSHLICQLQTIVSRNISPLEAAVLSVGTIHGGYAYNIIADRVTINGTVRTMQTSVQDKIIARIHELADGLAISFPGIKAQVKYEKGYPCTNNTSVECVNHVREAALKTVDSEHVTDQGVQTMGAEDFSYFLLARPGCFYFVASRPTHDNADRPHHKSTFDFHEGSLEISASTFVYLIENRFGFSAQ